MLFNLLPTIFIYYPLVAFHTGAQRFLGQGRRIAAAPLSRLREIGGKVFSRMHFHGNHKVHGKKRDRFLTIY